MEITRGKILKPQKIGLYAPEGIGKTTFASKFPDPLFIDTEGGTSKYDVKRLPAPSSWTMLLEEVQFVVEHPDCCSTLVVDTIDWAQKLCIDHVVSTKQWSGLEDVGWGKGYVYVYEEFGKLLNRLDDVIDRGINVVLTAHAAMRKFEQPDEMGSYDRWEMKLLNSKNCNSSAMVKEWVDTLIFANYKTHTVTVDKEGKKKKAIGTGQRVMYTSHHSCWDAKNRDNLPDELPFDYSQIAHLIPDKSQLASTAAPQAITQPAPQPAPQPAVRAIYAREETPQQPAPTFTNPPAPDPEVPDKSNTDKAAAETKAPEPAVRDGGGNTLGDPAARAPVKVDERIPKALRDLMIENNVDEWDIQSAVAAKGYYTSDMNVWDYDPGFIDGVLVGAWAQVFTLIKEIRQKQEVPFN